MRLPVLPGQKIAKGDIVTLSGEPGHKARGKEPGHAMHAESAGDTGDARNWGDVSRGAFMAREAAADPGTARGPRMVWVMPPSGYIITLLDGGIAVGELVGVDLRTDTGKERVDRNDVVTSAHRPPGGNAGRLWQQARLIPHERRDEPLMRKALLGRVQEILATREREPVTRSGHNDCAIVR
ncbi:MAG: hypothetical protein EB824_06840, partial [Thaumarchaeota archaeon S15]